LVKVYSTPTCPWCVKVKDYLKSLHVAYEDVNVAADIEAARAMVQRTNQRGVPVIEIGEAFIVGFDKAALDEELKKAGLTN